MAKLRTVHYDSDHVTESPAQDSFAPFVVVQNDNRRSASATGAGTSAGPTVKHGVGEGLMVQGGLLSESKKAALEHRAQENKKREERKKEEEKKRKKKDKEVSGTSIEPQKKKFRTEEGAKPTGPSAETAIVPFGENSMVVVDVYDSPDPVSTRYDINF